MLTVVVIVEVDVEVVLTLVNVAVVTVVEGTLVVNVVTEVDVGFLAFITYFVGKMLGRPTRCHAAGIPSTPFRRLGGFWIFR